MRFDVRDTRNENWLWIRREMLRVHGDKLGMRGVSVYAALASFADLEDQTAHPSISSVADMLDISKPTVRKAINDLVDLGWLGYKTRTREDGTDTSHRFYLLSCPVKNDSGVGENSLGVGENSLGGRVNSVRGEGKLSLPHEEERIEEEGNEVCSSGGCRGRGRGESSGDSLPEDVEVSTSEDTSEDASENPNENPFRPSPPPWLSGKDERYASTMAKLYDRYEPRADHLQQIARNQWWESDVRSGRQPDIHKGTISAHIDRYDWPKLVAAYVLARRANGQPQDYADAILENDFQPPSNHSSEDDAQPDDFARKAKRTHEAARRGAGLDR